MTQFLVSRTSAWDERPCDEAFQIDIVRTDTRNVDDPKKIPANNGTDGTWYLDGTNHRVENGRIKRDMGVAAVWVVEVSDLLSFIDKYGECVIGKGINDFYTLEIYDDYRE